MIKHLLDKVVNAIKIKKKQKIMKFSIEIIVSGKTLFAPMPCLIKSDW